MFFCKQKTAYEMRISDWSSDVCSSDLQENAEGRGKIRQADRKNGIAHTQPGHHPVVFHDQYVGHDHQLQQHQHEDQIATLASESRKRVGVQNRQHQLVRKMAVRGTWGSVCVAIGGCMVIKKKKE